MASPPAPVAVPTSSELEILKKYSDYLAKNAEKFPAFNNLISRSSGYMNQFGLDTSSAKDKLDKLSQAVSSSGITLSQMGAVSTSTARNISLLATAIFDVKDALSGFSSEGTVGFTSQVGDIYKMIDSLGKAGDLAGLSAFATKLGITETVTKENLGSITKTIKDAINNMARQGDNLIRVRDAYLQAAAATGDYGDVVRASGENFSQINLLLSNQVDLLANTIQATNLTKEQAESYYLSLSKIPGLLGTVINRQGQATDQTSAFVAVIQMARGAGRDFASVQSDLATAFENYGLKGKEALLYVSDMTSLQEKFKLRLEDVRQSINSTSATFKNFVDTGEAANRMQQSAVNIMSTYVQGFINTKMTGQGAIDIITSMTGKMKGLTLEQRAFLSAQTGGPGGIRGGLQIEKMLREGKTDEVLEKVRQTMLKQFGKIVTLEEATKSDAAAAQFTRQRSLLTKGPFGQIARSDEEAARMLEVFKDMGRGKRPTAMKDRETSLDESIMKGETLQRIGSYNDIARMRNALDALELKAMIPAAETVKDITAIGTPTGPNQAAALQAQAGLQAGMKAAATRTVAAAEGIASVTTGGNIQTVGPERAMYESLTDIQRVIENTFSNTLPAAMSTITGAIIPETVQKAASGAFEYLKEFFATPEPSTTTPTATPAPAPGTTAELTPPTPATATVTVEVFTECTQCHAKTPHSTHERAVRPT